MCSQDGEALKQSNRSAAEAHLHIAKLMYVLSWISTTSVPTVLLAGSGRMPSPLSSDKSSPHFHQLQEDFLEYADLWITLKEICA